MARLKPEHAVLDRELVAVDAGEALVSFNNSETRDGSGVSVV